MWALGVSMLKSLFLSLALREIDKGETRSNAVFSAAISLSFFVLINFLSVLILGEFFWGTLFIEINNLLFSPKYYEVVVLLLYFLAALTIYNRYKNIDLAVLEKKHQTSIGKFMVYAAFSGFVFVCSMFLHI